MKTSKRNGAVVDVLRVDAGDEIMTITASGMIQRFSVDEIRVTARNTQGVRLMKLKEDDLIVAVNRIPRDEIDPSSKDELDSESDDAENANSDSSGE